MEYTSLRKIYYISPDKHDSIYNNRFNSCTTRHFAIDIREIKRQNAYPAFLCYDAEISLLIQRIYQKYIQLEKIIEHCPHVMLEQYAISCLIEEVQSTNEIEGVKSTKKQIKNIIQKLSVPAKYRHLISVVDKYLKILNQDDFPFYTCMDIRKFYDSFALNEVVQEDPGNAPDGEIFRKTSVVVTSRTDRAKHEGLMPEKAIISAMENALTVLHDESIPILVRLSLFHYFFEYIHPFYDGNGRTGRFIVSYYLAQEFDPLVALRLSVVVNKNKNSYYKIFEDTDSEWNRGDVTPFVIRFMSFIATAFDDTINILSRKQEQLARFAKTLDKQFADKDPLTKNIYYLLLQASLFSAVGITMDQMMNVTQKTRTTINNRIKEIPESHYIVDKGEKPYHYRLNMGILLE